jgi:hypothetical protein
MLQPNYTDKESKLFTGRTSYLKRLEDSAAKNKPAILLAPSGFGRTALLRNFAAKNDSLYIDLSALSLSPESFAVDFIGTVCFLGLAKGLSELGEYQTISKLKQIKLGRRCAETISRIDNELQKIKPDQQLLLKSAFGFPEEFAAEQGKKITIVLNNFDESLKFNNFSQVKDATGLFFDSISKAKNCSFVLSSPAIYLMKQELKRQQADKQIDIVELSPLSLDETKDLFEKVAGKADDRVAKEVHALSAGIPLIVKSLASRFAKEKTNDVQKNIRLVKYMLISDLATSTSPSYFYCSKLFSGSLSRARGETLLKSILKVVSQNTPLRLTEIAKLVYRSAPVTKSLLERLIEVDLIVKNGNVFDFSNPVLKLWCRLYFGSVEFSEVPDERALSDIGGLL